MSMHLEGNRILSRRPEYDKILLAARAGILPLFWMGCAVVYGWGKRYFGLRAAVAAVFFATFLPPVLAHVGVATTDMALTAFLCGAFLAGAVWLESPNFRTGVAFGALAGLAVLSKFSSLVFFPAAAAIALIWYLVRERPSREEVGRSLRAALPSFGIAVLTSALVVWAGYRFSFGPVASWHVSLPAPELFQGIQDVAKHNREGHPTYLLGERSHSGFWYFYPVALAVKTPLAFIALAAMGVGLALRKSAGVKKAWLPLALILGVLAVAFTSRINIGVRHILPVYLGFSILGGAAAVQWLERGRTERWRVGVVGVLVLWFAGSSLAVHPDYLAYFNELAGSEPEKILVDSDLDWGQDMKRTAARLRELGAQSVTLQPMVIAEYEEQLGFPKIARYVVDALNPAPGWNAISISEWKIGRLGLFEKYPQYTVWPDRAKPLERVGKGMLLYYFPGVTR